MRKSLAVPLLAVAGLAGAALYRRRGRRGRRSVERVVLHDGRTAVSLEGGAEAGRMLDLARAALALAG